MIRSSLKIEPLVGIICYDNQGIKKQENVENATYSEQEDITKYFDHLKPDFFKWVRKYNEITIFRGSFRATYMKVLDTTILFISRFENISAEIRYPINRYVEDLGNKILESLVKGEKNEFLEDVCNIGWTPEDIKDEIKKIFNRLNIKFKLDFDRLITRDTPIFLEQNNKSEIFEESRPFELVPQIKFEDMTYEIVSSANKKAIISLLFSSIKGCISPAASAFIFSKNDGTVGELYAGDLEEHKIIYVLETISKFPRVIQEMLNSLEDIKVLNAEVVQIIDENCHDGKLLIGMTTNDNDVMKVGYKFKIVKHVIQTIGF